MEGKRDGGREGEGGVTEEGRGNFKEERMFWNSWM